MKTLLIVVLGFVGGFAGRGVFETLDAPWWGSILVYAPLFVGTLWVSRRLDRETKRETRKPFADELATFLEISNWRLIPKKLHQLLLSGQLVGSEFVERGRVVVMNRDELRRIMDEWPRPHDVGRPYVPLCTHSIGCPAHLAGPCPVEKINLSMRLAVWPDQRHTDGCPARWTPVGLCGCGGDGS